MNDIDKITLRKRLIDVYDEYLEKKRNAEKMAASDDKVLSIHKKYWLELADRYSAQADKIDELRKMI